MNTGSGLDFPCPVRRVGDNRYHHFFGYYNKHIWDRSGRYLLANRVPYMTRDLSSHDEAEVGFFDLSDNDRFWPLGQTTAWNWQMGCQLQWLDGREGRQVIYNARRNEPDPRLPYPDFCSVIHNADTGESSTMPLPVYVVTPDSRYALCVDYRRLSATHPTIGYATHEGSSGLPLAPEDDGIFRMDLDTGDYELVVSLEQLRLLQPVASMDRAIHWVTHIEINPGSSRAVLLHRWTERVEDETCWMHRLLTVNVDGSDLRILETSDHPVPQLDEDFDPDAVRTFDYEKSEYQISHPTWRDDTHVMVWGPHAGEIHYHLYDDRTGEAAIIGNGVLVANGHMTYSPDAQWLLTDTYPDDDTHKRTLILFELANNYRYNVGWFYADPALGKVNRCDLHPRWSRDGRAVCVDSVHEDARQLYIVDVSKIVDKERST